MSEAGSIRDSRRIAARANLEIAVACEFLELQDALSTYEIDATGSVETVTQILTDLGPERAEAIRTAFFEREGVQDQFPTNELSAGVIESACTLLGVVQADRWTFEKADQDIPPLCQGGDDHLGYVVDLNESGVSATRGLDMLRALWESNSRGTPRIARTGSFHAGKHGLCRP